jgi:type VI secretion system protein ImpG
VSNRERCYEAVRSSGGYTLTLDDPLPVESLSFVITPTPPEPASGQQPAWRLLGALRLNYFSLFGERGEGGAEPWRALLTLFVEPQNRFAGATIAGLVGASVTTAVERLPGPGPLSFARGADVVLDVDRHLIESGQYFALGAILDALLAGYASVNSFTRISLRDPRGHVLHRWPARLGLHECL